MRANLIHYAEGCGCDTALIDRWLDVLCKQYGTASIAVALERHFKRLEEVALILADPSAVNA